MSEEKGNLEKRKSRCQVRDCVRNPFTSIHRLPKNISLIRQKWIEILELPSDFRHTFYVCGEHFVEKDFKEGKMRRRLRHKAVPSVNLPSTKRKLKVKAKVKNTIVSKSLDEIFLEWDNKYKILFESSVDEEILGI